MLRLDVRIHSEFLNCIFCEGRYYNTMHYITLGGRMSGTMSGIIEAVITTGWSLQPPPAITWNAHYTHGISPGSTVLLLLYHHSSGTTYREIFTDIGSILKMETILFVFLMKRENLSFHQLSVRSQSKER